MKKKILKLVLATSVLTAVVSAGTVSAAATPTAKAPAATAPKAATAPAAVKSSLSFNGMNTEVRTLAVNNVTLVAVRDLADALGASLEVNAGLVTLQLVNTVELKAKDTAYTVNGAAMSYTTAPVNAGGSLFVELDSTIDGLGGSVETSTAGTKTYRSFKLLEGEFSSPNWIDGNKIIAVKDGDTKAIYKIDPTDMSYELYSDNEDALDMKVSPDGQYGIYVNTDGQLQLKTLNPGTVRLLSADKTLKTDLTWSADSKKVFFAQGDNQEKLSYIDLATKVITKVSSDDTVQFKSELRLSPDGTKLLYTQNVLGATASTFKAASGPDDLAASEDTLAVDYNTAGSQLFSLDLATAGAKPVKLTDGKSNTFNASILNDGSVVYVNVDLASDTAKGSLKIASAAGVIKDLVADLDVASSIPTVSGAFIITGADAAGKTHVAMVTADGKKTDIVVSDSEISDITPSTDGISIFAIVDGKLVIFKNGILTYLTK